MNSFLKTVLFVAVRVIGCMVIAALAGYLCGAALGLAMTWENNQNPELPYGNYWWWANFTGLIFMMFTWLPGAVIGLLWSVGVLLEKRAAAKNKIG